MSVERRLYLNRCAPHIFCFTYNPRPVMKVSYNSVFVPEECHFVCYNRASFFGWIAFSHGFRN
ncbi:hypothetical protein CXH12_00905 [Citrobacter portucalensis]|nr:hypothetical protein CXH12_00905 [Citrobacter portucalensis]RWT96247.1 hypothetical protein DN590_08015 [Citrobacter freundii]